MTTKSPFLPRLSHSRNDNSSILPLHNSRYSSLRNQPSEYDLDELSPRAESDLLSASFHEPNPSPPTSTTRASNSRKPTGAVNRRPSNSSSSGSTSKTRHHNERVLFSGPPPPIAASRVLYRDEEQRQGYASYEDDESSGGGVAASWLPGTARRAISSVIWDRSDNRSGQDQGERPVSYDRNSVWRSLARRERAIVADVQRFLQVQEESLNGSGERVEREGSASLGIMKYSDSVSDGGSATPTGTGTGTASINSSRHPGRSVSFLEPTTRSGPGGEVIPVRQPRQKKLGIGGARKGITRSMAELANLKAEEDASLSTALSARKQALSKLRKLALRRDGIADELNTLEMDQEEPLKQELEDLDNEHRGICTEIQDLEERLAGLKNRRRYLEGRMNDVRNRREAGLSGYKNALKEIEDTVKGFLARPPVKPLDVEALVEKGKGEEQLLSPGGVEFMHLRPERRTTDMAREWWESEVNILEKRKVEVDTERAALEEGGEVWEDVVHLVLEFEADLRKQVMQRTEVGDPSTNAKGKEREPTAEEIMKKQHENINTVITGLEQQLGIAEEKGWNLLIAAIGAELDAFREAARVNRDILKAAGLTVEELVPSSATEIFREDSGTTGNHNSFHTANGGSMMTDKLMELPTNEEDGVAESDNEVPRELLATHAEEHLGGICPRDDHEGDTTGAEIAPFDREDSENDVPPEFLVEQHDTRE